MADARTLRLVHPDVSPEKLSAFIKYQQALLKALLETSGDDWAGRFAFGHAKALKDSGLEGHEQRRIATAVEAFCGRLWSARRLEERLDEAKQGASPKDARILQHAPGQVEHLKDLTDLEQTLGAVTLATLKGRQEELLQLHRDVASAEGRGHLHVKG
jgi:hypothetical protein